ncbi:D-3-phosphoglycerate dehydrogenase [Thermanaeromonas toyohensis ToBE]|uniref:D-3-phosphoglycerate dehydrogenase n=1 Tax=Thermanaeromonas toyohensis ToBE TaxID=698762 RepID=A0A1W1V6B4_9FIRM|nr:phosphoglycerate dehydrogenase [Thermanaeromonas toyohensis]SMB88601.1 D-3-phosphoglycerate dehydrogenase [Thermanaeromonas toyohensis ToBE]
MRVLALDDIDIQGIKVLKEAGLEVEARGKMAEEELKNVLPAFDALIVRSATKVTASALAGAKRLRIIGRAGVGIDNIDVEAATEKGILVVNAPEGNTIAAAEHTLALMLALARNIPQASALLKQGIWEKKKFVGVELRHKTLGILGLGKIGSEVARRARAFDMRLLAYDPYVAPEQAERLGVALLPLEEVLKQADFLTLHLPLTRDTYHLLDREKLSLLKPTARLLNVARGGIVDEEALYEALTSGRLAGAALDVFEEEPLTESPLFKLDNVIVTPHLGASTAEAQVAVAVEVAQDVVRCLKGEPVLNAVNIPVVRGQAMETLRPYLKLVERLGSFLSQLMEGPILEAELSTSGELAQHELSPLTNAFLKGLLRPLLGEAVNYVNAPVVARKRGIRIRENKTQEMGYYTTLITATVKGRREGHTVAGAVNQRGEPRLVGLNGYSLDAELEGHMLVVPHIDKPRIIGPVGLAIGDYGINIAGMQVGRREAGGEAVMILRIDSEVPREVLGAIRQVDGVLDVRYLRL